MELRPYRQSDHEQVVSLHELSPRDAGDHQGAGQPDDDLRDIAAAYTADGGEFWVGEIDGRIAATGAFRQTPSETAEITRLRVAPEYRGRGYGGLMLDKLEERAKELGYELLHLESPEGEEAARKLFDRAGYSMHERRVVDGDVRLMYLKWLAPPEAAKEMTPEEEAAFYADWDVSQEVTEYAKKLLREGATPEQAMERVLASELYAVWCGKKRCFAVGYDSLELYEDLHSSVRSDQYIGSIEEKAAAHFDAAAATTSEPAPVSDAPEESDEPVFAEMGMRIKPSRLAVEMAAFSRAVGLSRPIRYIHFLALFSGATIVGMEQEELDRLVANKDLAVELAQAFADLYGDDTAGESVERVQG
ncbi:GNAT family N-acetyltransferase [Paenibacillus mesophilus]|uniref:GNAT family N-acetyltransferase n=1 Tax=Paenibacillus mesophilus TaxID=2582849 RepID=UPI0013051A90|nr:GNAT family N-acetyltransferase [Paenibacillus mesophilus]